MQNRFGLNRFKKAQASEPFHVDEIRASADHESRMQQPQTTLASHGAAHHFQAQPPGPAVVSYPAKPTQSATEPTAATQKEPGVTGGAPGSSCQATTVGGGASTWQPPEWAVEPRQGVYHLEVSKDGQVVDKIPLDKKRSIFGRQHATCDFVLDHPSLSRQHAAVVHHKNGSVYVIDMGSVHGTFVSNERLQKDIPVEIEPGQSLRFAASTRTYILRKATNVVVPPVLPSPPENLQLPPPPDTSDLDAVVEYNTLMNRLGHPGVSVVEEKEPEGTSSRKRKRQGGEGPLPGFETKNKVRFRDQDGGILVEIVGFSDGADVASEPGPIGAREGGSLVGKFDSLVRTVLVPKLKTKNSAIAPGEKEDTQSTNSPGPTSTVQQQNNTTADFSRSSSAGLGDAAPASLTDGGLGSALGKKPRPGMSPKLREFLGRSLSKTRGLYGGLEDGGVPIRTGAWGKVDASEATETQKDGEAGDERDIFGAHG